MKHTKAMSVEVLPKPVESIQKTTPKSHTVDQIICYNETQADQQVHLLHMTV